MTLLLKLLGDNVDLHDDDQGQHLKRRDKKLRKLHLVHKNLCCPSRVTEILEW
ncbi:hypothetical protein J6590_076801 [Homalodisca vitripennis]|nr:hypothetical protein J6590_076801 [Homalodisca vitripennis]